MRNFSFFIILSSLLFCFSCGKKTNDIAVYEQYKPEQVLDFPTATWKPGDTMSIYHYLEEIAYKMDDSTKAIQMAKRDADLGAYFIMRFGLIRWPHFDDESIYDKMRSDQKKICLKHNI